MHLLNLAAARFLLLLFLSIQITLKPSSTIYFILIYDLIELKNNQIGLAVTKL